MPLGTQPHRPPANAHQHIRDGATDTAALLGKLGKEHNASGYISRDAVAKSGTFRSARAGEMHTDIHRLERIAGGILAIIALLAIANAACPVAYEWRCERPLPAYRLWQGCHWLTLQCECWR
jgi:hypothetical protein